jgi:hypothetical protein
MKNELTIEDQIGKLNYKPKQIVQDYLIKVYGYINGQRINKLLGVYGLVQLVGYERANKMLDRAYACTGDVQRCKVYGGVQVSFYIH